MVTDTAPKGDYVPNLLTMSDANIGEPLLRASVNKSRWAPEHRESVERPGRDQSLAWVLRAVIDAVRPTLGRRRLAKGRLQQRGGRPALDYLGV